MWSFGGLFHDSLWEYFAYWVTALVSEKNLKFPLIYIRAFGQNFPSASKQSKFLERQQGEYVQFLSNNCFCFIFNTCKREKHKQNQMNLWHFSLAQQQKVHFKNTFLKYPLP